jgi:putative transposase
MPDRLRRLEATFESQPIYFVTACTDERRSILANKEIHSRLIEFAKEGTKRGVWFGDYVIMPDHIHGFVAFDDAKLTLSSWVKSLKLCLSKVLRIQGVLAPHWPKGFFDHVLRSRDSYSAKWDYVRNNPVRAGLVENATEWPFIGRVVDLEFRHDRA